MRHDGVAHEAEALAVAAGVLEDERAVAVDRLRCAREREGGPGRIQRGGDAEDCPVVGGVGHDGRDVAGDGGGGELRLVRVRLVAELGRDGGGPGAEREEDMMVREEEIVGDAEACPGGREGACLDLESTHARREHHAERLHEARNRPDEDGEVVREEERFLDGDGIGAGDEDRCAVGGARRRIQRGSLIREERPEDRRAGMRLVEVEDRLDELAIQEGARAEIEDLLPEEEHGLAERELVRGETDALGGEERAALLGIHGHDGHVQLAGRGEGPGIREGVQQGGHRSARPGRDGHEPGHEAEELVDIGSGFSR